MWVVGNIKKRLESIPLELGRYTGPEEDFWVSKAELHSNILTPDKIPEFCLPPRLCKRSLLLEDETPNGCSRDQTPRGNTHSDMKQHKTNDVKAKTGDVVCWKAGKKPLPFSAEGYGLAGMYESPNTRRKESLFHSKCPTYVFDRSLRAAVNRLPEESARPKSISPFSGILPLFSCKTRPQTGGTDSEPASSRKSSPSCSSSSATTFLSIPSGSRHLKGATSCPSLVDIRDKVERGAPSSKACARPSSLGGSSLTLAPPVLFPLDVLQCQERLQREHVLPLRAHGNVRLSAERTLSTNTFSSRFTVRVRLVSVEGLRHDDDRRPLNCAVSVCLTPGKLQRQNSATIRNCRSPVFNEDFFFTGLSRDDLLELQLRFKVLDKPAAGTLRRGTVIGEVSKPLSQLLPLMNE